MHRALAGLRSHRIFGWGLASQLSSSVTSFGLSLLAARVVGAAGLGAVVAGFAIFLLMQSMQRALLLEPMNTTTAASSGKDRRKATSCALTIVLLGGIAALLAMIAVAQLLPAALAHGIYLFLPWVIPCLVEDCCRAVCFRDGDGAGAALIDATWLVTGAVLTPVAVLSQSPAVVVACWGAGGTVAASLGLMRTRIMPAALRESLHWWLRDAWPIGRWLGSNTVIYAIASQGFVLVVGAMIGAEALGGLRAAETLFAPLSLLIPALALPGLPAMSRRIAHSRAAGRAFALRLGASATILTAAYLAVALVLGDSLLAHVFGPAFQQFSSLFWPLGMGQLAIAPAIGLTLFLIAQQRGRPLLLGEVLKAAALFGPGLLLVSSFGVTGAAWAMSLAWLVQHVVIAAAALSPTDPTPLRRKATP